MPDAGGMGQGAMHVLHEARKRVFEFNSNGKPTKPRRYANLISQAWFELAHKVKKRKCYLPNDPMLMQQLCTRHYSMDRHGLIVIETKDNYRKRGYPSPDRADGCVLAMSDLGISEGIQIYIPGGQRRVAGAL